MEAEQKAKELIQDFEAYIEQACNQSGRESHYLAAKWCARMAVERILDLPVFWDGTPDGIDTEGDDNFWRAVQKELNNL